MKRVPLGPLCGVHFPSGIEVGPVYWTQHNWLYCAYIVTDDGSRGFAEALYFVPKGERQRE